jgi:phosphoserine phosphatase
VTDEPVAAPEPPASVVPEGLDATLVLLRHGESEWIVENRFQGQSETPLSPLGHRQGALAGERIAAPHASPALPVPDGLPLEIVHSPLSRAAQTAAYVADAIERRDGARVAVRPDAGFLELGQGEWEGLHQDEIAARYPDVLSGWRRRPWEVWAPGGESLASVQARVRSSLAGTLERLGRDYPRGTLDRPQVGGYAGVGPGAGQPWTVIVGHDGVFKVTLLTLFGLPLTHFWMFTMGLTGITVVELRGGRPVLRAANLTEHLAPLSEAHAVEQAEKRARSGAL